MSRKPHPVHTVGHSNLELERFMDLLERNRVQMVADVRSSPYSRHVPQFNREKLAEALGERGFGYLHMGDQLGGRPNANRLYDEKGQADYRLMALEPGFQADIRQLAQIAGERHVALMCTERDPLKCHRTLLVSPALEEAGIPVIHIMGDTGRMTHEDLMDRLVKAQRLPQQAEVATNRREAVELAVDRQVRREAYRKR